MEHIAEFVESYSSQSFETIIGVAIVAFCTGFFGQLALEITVVLYYVFKGLVKRLLARLLKKLISKLTQLHNKVKSDEE